MMLYRCRDEALFADAEWSWTADRDEAWIFKHYDCGEPEHEDIATCATTHARKLREAGEARCHAVVLNEAAVTLRREERARRDGDAAAQLEASCRSAECGIRNSELKPRSDGALPSRKRKSARTRCNRSRHVSPEECFENYEKQHLA
jgi:hypothetical protein